MTGNETVRTLTVRQPWATLIADGQKHYETRRWGTSYRGPLLIHAGQRIDSRLAFDLWMNRDLITDPLDMPNGAIVAVAELVNVHHSGELLAAGSVGAFERRIGDFGPGRCAWELTSVRKIDRPVKAQGKQGLWTPAPAIVEAVIKQVGAI